MNFYSVLTSASIITGAAILLVSIFNFVGVYKKLRGVTIIGSRLVRFLFRLNLVLMFFFLIGYIAVLLLVVFNLNFAGMLFVGIVFFSGSVFVLVGTFLNSKFISEVKKSNLQAIKLLVSAAEARDPYTMGHSEHVANLLMLLYEYLPRESTKNINRDLLRYTGLLHDIGKIGVPESILNNPGQLSEDEMGIMKNHTLIGAGIVSNVDWLQPISKWILYHHERMDGKGYNFLKADDIPYTAKMISVVDTYSSMVTIRKYRPALSHAEAVKMLQEISGRQLDELIVSCFTGIGETKIKTCLPGTGAVKYADEFINTDNFDTDNVKLSLLGHVLNRETGLACIKKYFDLALRHKYFLAICDFKVKGLEEKKTADYHLIDRISAKMETVMNRRIRKSDIFCRLNRTEYLFVFAKCRKEYSVKAVETIQEKCMNLEVVKKLKNKIKFETKFIEINPSDDSSYQHAMDYLNRI